MTAPQTFARYQATPTPELFAQLVAENIHLVHAAACRQLTDQHLADDVTQAVFILLARKAPAIHSALAGWLITTTHYACRDARKLAARRVHHERQAMKLRPELAPPAQEPDWLEYAPFLDAALVHLSTKDRDLLTLRYLQNLPLRTIALIHNLSEEAARKRIDRALPKLRAILSRRIAAPTVALLAAALITESAHAAPASLALSISTATSSTFTPLIAKATAKSLSLLKAKVAASFALTAVAVLGTTISVTYIATKPAVTVTTIPASQPVAQQFPDPDEPESKISGDTQFTRYDVTLTADALPDFLKIATPLTAPGKLYQPYTATGVDLRRLIRTSIDNNTLARVSDGMAFANFWDPHNNTYYIGRFESFQDWDTSQNQPVSLTAGISSDNSTFTRIPSGNLHLHLDMPEISLNVADATMGLTTSTGPVQTSITFDGDLSTGNALIFIAKLTTPAKKTYYHLLIWETFHALPEQMNVITQLRDPLWWSIHGPAHLRQYADVSRFWSAQANPVQAADPRYEQTLSDGKKIRLVALGRPAQFPGCWWDPQGNPIEALPSTPSITDDSQGKLYALITVDGSTREYHLAEPDQYPNAENSQYNSFSRENFYPLNENSSTLHIGTLVGPWKNAAHLTINIPLAKDGVTYLVSKPNPFEKKAFLVRFQGTHSPNASDTLIAIASDNSEYPTAPPEFTRTSNPTNIDERLIFHNAYENIKSFRVEERQREWTTFTGFATSPHAPPPTFVAPATALAAEKARDDLKAEIAAKELIAKRAAWAAIPPDTQTPRGFMRTLITAAQTKNKSAMQKLMVATTSAADPLRSSFPDTLIALASLHDTALARFGEQKLAAALQNAPDDAYIFTDLEADWLDQKWTLRPDGSQTAEDFLLKKSPANTYLLDLDSLAADPGLTQQMQMMTDIATQLEKTIRTPPTVTLPQLLSELKKIQSAATQPTTSQTPPTH